MWIYRIKTQNVIQSLEQQQFDYLFKCAGVKLISCCDLKEQHIIIIVIKKSEKENFSTLSVCNNEQNFTDNSSTVVVAQWVRRWSSDHRVVQVEGSSPGGDIYQTFLFQFC